MNDIRWPDGFVAGSTAMRSLLDTVSRVLGSYTTILIVGSTGTGKNCIAEAIHTASPVTRGKPFVVVNCGALSDQESLFLTRSASSSKSPIHQAQYGTFFLDEVQDMPPEHQRRLIRLLQVMTDLGETRVPVRILSSSSTDLDGAVAAGTFRNDLYYRLRVVEITLPLLRDRPDDIEPLANHFLSLLSISHGIHKRSFDASALKVLKNYHWPGNVRQLFNAVESAALLTNREVLCERDFPKEIWVPFPLKLQVDSKVADIRRNNDISIKRITKEIEETLIREALARTKGNKSAAAKILEISHRALLYKMKEYGVVSPMSPADHPTRR